MACEQDPDAGSTWEAAEIDETLTRMSWQNLQTEGKTGTRASANTNGNPEWNARHKAGTFPELALLELPELNQVRS